MYEQPTKTHILAMRIPKHALHSLAPQRNRHVAPSPSKCTDRYIYGLRISRHVKVVHNIDNILLSSNLTRCYQLINVGSQHNRPCDNTLPSWFLPCECYFAHCTCLATQTRHNVCHWYHERSHLAPHFQHLACMSSSSNFPFVMTNRQEIPCTQTIELQPNASQTTHTRLASQTFDYTHCRIQRDHPHSCNTILY